MINNKVFKYSFLLLFVVSCCMIPYAIKNANENTTVFLRSIRIIFLIGYYISSVKRPETIFVISLIPFLISGVFFVFDASSVYGMLALILSRILLVKVITPRFDKIDWKFFTRITALFIIVALLILSLFYKNTTFFYISASTGLTLIVLLSLAFTNLMEIGNKNGNLEMFLAIFIFMISDLVFGIQKINETNDTNMMLSSVFYNIAYFLICYSLIKRDESKII